MRAVVIHLSDIHIDSSEHPILSRAESIAASIRSVGLKFDACFIAVTGDVAYSGKFEEYKLGKVFFDALTEAIRRTDPDVAVHWVLVPGNHDCDLRRASDVRQPDLVTAKLPALNLNGDLLRHFVEVQTPFFDFAATFASGASSCAERLFYTRTYDIGGKKILFNCFNTAWLTQNPERPAKLYYPIHAIRPAEHLKSADVSISLFHHPYNWLEPSNSHEFEQRVESMSDLLLTGHEHTSDLYRKITREGGEVRFIEAEPLWDTNTHTSGFKVVILDLTAAEYEILSFSWTGTYYESSASSVKRTFSRNELRNGDGIVNDASFLELLDDVGTAFTHPFRRQRLRLSDLFVYPNLQEFYAKAKVEGKRGTRVLSADVRGFALGQARLLLAGADSSGKTALARTLYMDCRREGLVPVLLSGEQLASGDERQIVKFIDDTYAKQYSARSLQAYKQLDPASKVFLVDDFHRAKLKRKGQDELLGVLHRLAGKVFVFVDDLFPIDEIADHGGMQNPFASYHRFQILPLNYSLTIKLTGRWVALGRDQNSGEDDLYRETTKRAKVISTLLGKQYLPYYPLFVLGVLQAYEATRGLNTANGSLGELYEALITDRLALVSKASTDLGTKYTYISRMAYHLFCNDVRQLSDADLAAVNREYFAEFDISIDPSALVSRLLDAQILCRVGGNVQFKYQHFYQFFVARYFRDNLRDPEEGPVLRARLQDMADRVYCEEYANVLIFFIYLTRDTELIEFVLSNAARIYSGTEPCALESEVEFVNRLYSEQSRPLLVSADLESNRRSYHASIDAAEECGPVDSTNGRGDRIAYDSSLDDLTKINIAFKTLQILGQVLRNFPGVLRADLKTRVANECYQLGLRVLSVILGIARDNLEELRTYFSQLVREQRPMVAVGDQLARETDEVLIALTEACTYGVIKRISQSVGIEELSETYRKILQLGGSKLSYSLIDVSIKLDHFSGFPENEFLALQRRVRDNRLGCALLRDFVANHLFLFRIDDYRVHQRITKLLDIDVKGPKLIEATFVKSA